MAVEGYMTDLITERSLRFIEQHAGERFFIDVAYNAPHWRYQPPHQPSVAPDNARHPMPHEPGAKTRAEYVAIDGGPQSGRPALRHVPYDSA